jgi:molecular chaperone GrpE
MTSRPERDFSVPPEQDGSEGVDERADDESTDPLAFVEPPDAVGSAAEEILTDVVALTAERDEYLAALQRAQADFANYRKRVLRQQEEQKTRAAVDIVAKVLPALDALDLAVAHLDKDGEQTEPSTEAQALRQARSLLIDALLKEGLERVDDVGVAFDPSVHDAVAHVSEEDGEGEPGAKIEEVLRSGYRWQGQTLRPAMVRVRG